MTYPAVTPSRASRIPKLNATSLDGGENVSGNVTYDLPAAHGELVYAPNINGPPVAEWLF